jgi:hypothetical protein
MIRAQMIGTIVRYRWSPSAERSRSTCSVTYDHENQGFAAAPGSDEMRLTVGT